MNQNILHKGSFGIPDSDIDSFIANLNSQKGLKWLRDVQTDTEFTATYEDWLFSSKDFFIHDLDRYKFQVYIVQGTTQSFHDFYQIHHDKTLKIKKGEYPYHKAFFNSIGRKWAWIDDQGLCSNDFVILSCPFSGNGNIGEEIYETLDLCNKYSIPVLLDCSFWGLSESFSFSCRDYPCIQMVAFSLSKFFNVGRLRIGMMYSQYKEKASGAILAPYHYINSWSAYISYELINNFSIDYMTKKYRSFQREICKELNISPSSTLLFGTGEGEKWKDFSRDDRFNRICLSQAIQNKYQQS